LKKNLKMLFYHWIGSWFIQATGASETELLGDVRSRSLWWTSRNLEHNHMNELFREQSMKHMKGVLFIDEIVHIAPLQRYILSAMAGQGISNSLEETHRVQEVQLKLIMFHATLFFIAACNIRDVSIHFTTTAFQEFRGRVMKSY